MPKPISFEEQYPTIYRFVQETGWIEIGQHGMISAFVRAFDFGNTVYEDKDTYPSMAAVLQELETGIKAYLDERGI